MSQHYKGQLAVVNQLAGARGSLKLTKEERLAIAAVLHHYYRYSALMDAAMDLAEQEPLWPSLSTQDGPIEEVQVRNGARAAFQEAIKSVVEMDIRDQLIARSGSREPHKTADHRRRVTLEVTKEDIEKANPAATNFSILDMALRRSVAQQVPDPCTAVLWHTAVYLYDESFKHRLEVSIPEVMERAMFSSDRDALLRMGSVDLEFQEAVV